MKKELGVEKGENKKGQWWENIECIINCKRNI